LAKEVDHRANNLLAVVEGVVALSRAGDAAAMREVIGGRVHALAKANQLLSQARWTAASLNRLLEEELVPFGFGAAVSRFSIEGPDVALSPAAAQALGMVLHELATNAVKHGSLADDAGRVGVCWSLESDGRLRLVWRESGGPMVKPPSGRGFGKSLIERAFTGALGGDSRLTWAPEGLVCELSFYPVAAGVTLDDG
jgi:two-component sensor histidine kinase